ncbi:hypothetical protein ES707_19903 [subsurface metagenome]
MFKIELRSRLNAIGIMTEIHKIQVAFQYFGFGQSPLQLDCPPEFNKFSLKGNISSISIDVTGQLLGQGGTTAKRTASEYIPGGTEYIHNAETVMIIEILILTGQKCLNQ